ncbi:hypothetical protein FSP39_001442 [Pinctada imbricata]|uniref:non-specific serine/threonine protein kinase n=1 Tax=Pinctada imbricata TaxID=66713 RepID=A0AA88Y9S9_PINIB|nr:hypothetical protein FSP39_001442 [Pinctada imbricata]
MAGSDTDNFELETTIGEGAFGKVYLCSDRSDKSKKYAMKVIDLTKSSSDERELAAKEAQLLAKIKHKNILEHIESFEKNGALCIVTEFCDQGDLAQFLEARNGKILEEARIVEWFQQICSALEYMHSQQMLHRDMKTQNVFLTGPNMVAKLGDLGLAKVLERPTAMAVTFCGSPYYMSPEIFACKPYDSKSDIWAMGVCVYEMATLERPFDATLMQQLVFKIVHGQLPPMPDDKYSKELITIMKKMLCKDANDRPSAADILKDCIFENHKSPAAPVNPSKKGAMGMSIRGNPALAAAAAGVQEDKGRFDMKSLVATLNQVHKRKRDKKMESVRKTANLDSSIMSTTYMDKDKTLTDKFSKGLQKSFHGGKKKDEDEEEDDLEDTVKGDVYKPPPMNPAKMMNLVVRTLTNVFPRKHKDDEAAGGDPGLAFTGDENDPEAMLLHQIEQLQSHCCKILGYQLFSRAYDMLDVTDDNMMLEEKLIKLLSPEKFAVVGVQLFYCKNFEYNLNKLKEGQGTSKA